MNEDELREFLPIFLDEAGEQMEILERGFLKLEHESTPELLQELFRAAHTVKGSSAAMGFMPMKELVHAMEDILDKLRHNELGVSTELIDAMFAGQDALKEMLDEVAATTQVSMDTTALTARLRAVLAGPTPASAPPAAAPAPAPVASPALETPSAAPPKSSPLAFQVTLSEVQRNSLETALETGCAVFGLKVTLASDCIMKSVRALMVLQALDRVGSVLAVLPDEEAIENDAVENDLEIVLATQQSASEIQAVVQTVNEIVGVDIAPWGSEQEFCPETVAIEAFDIPVEVSSSERTAIQDAVAMGCTIYNLKIEIAPDCLIKGARATMILQALEKVGSLLLVSPSEEAIEKEDFDHEFEVVLATQQGEEAVRACTMHVSEVTGVHIANWSATADAPTPAPAREAPVPAPVAMPVEVPQEAVTPSQTASAPAAPAPESVKPAAEKKAAAPVAQAQTVRVDVARLDKLLNLVGELVIDRTRIAQLGSRFEQEYAYSELLESLNETATHIGRITDELQEEIMKARMLPIDNVFSRFPRMMRDLAQKLEKELNFVVEGKETELDRSVIEVIGDPLIHMLRNSIDHGIEMPDVREANGKPRAGTVWLRARHEENHIVIEIEDDGKGMDPDKLRASAVNKGMLSQEAAARLTEKEALGLIFASGFSTAAQITDVSGRGVGMDIVKSNLQKLGATIDIDSKVGFGSRFTVKLPLTLAIIRGLLVTVQECVYALPLTAVVETLKISSDIVHVVNHREVILQRGKTLPIVRLRDVFRLPSVSQALVFSSLSEPARRSLLLGEEPAENDFANSCMVTDHAVIQNSETTPEPDALYIVVVGIAEKQVGLVVDSLIGEQEVVIKTLGKFIGDVRGISGATILGDGRVALIADINGIIHIATEERVRAYAA